MAEAMPKGSCCEMDKYHTISFYPRISKTPAVAYVSTFEARTVESQIKKNLKPSWLLFSVDGWGSGWDMRWAHMGPHLWGNVFAETTPKSMINRPTKTKE